MLEMLPQMFLVCSCSLKLVQEANLNPLLVSDTFSVAGIKLNYGLQLQIPHLFPSLSAENYKLKAH